MEVCGHVQILSLQQGCEVPGLISLLRGGFSFWLLLLKDRCTICKARDDISLFRMCVTICILQVGVTGCMSTLQCDSIGECRSHFQLSTLPSPFSFFCSQLLNPSPACDCQLWCVHVSPGSIVWKDQATNMLRRQMDFNEARGAAERVWVKEIGKVDEELGGICEGKEAEVEEEGEGTGWWSNGELQSESQQGREGKLMWALLVR